MEQDVTDALAAINAKLDGLTPAQQEQVDDAAEKIEAKEDAAEDAGESYDAKSAIQALSAKVDGWIAANPPKRTVPTKKPAPQAPASKAATGSPATPDTADAKPGKRRRGWFPE